MMESETYQHESPVWRDRANYVLLLSAGDGDREQVWAADLGDGCFMLCCLPFFASGLALGDTFRVGADLAPMVETPSGRSMVRVWIEDPNLVGRGLVDLIDENELIFEVRGRLMAIDLPTDETKRAVLKRLKEMESAGLIEYELPLGRFPRAL